MQILVRGQPRGSRGRSCPQVLTQKAETSPNASPSLLACHLFGNCGIIQPTIKTPCDAPASRAAARPAWTACHRHRSTSGPSASSGRLFVILHRGSAGAIGAKRWHAVEGKRRVSRCLEYSRRFVRHGARRKLQWTAHVCGVCLALKQRYGLLSRLATNYDAALLSAMVEAQTHNLRQNALAIAIAQARQG